MQPEFANVLAVNCHNFIIMNNDLYALLAIASPSLILTNAMTARIRDSQVSQDNLNDQNANAQLSVDTSSFPTPRFLKNWWI